MKRARKLLSLFLAIALVLSVFVLPASAATFKCPICEQYTLTSYHYDYTYYSSYHVMDGSCSKESGNHPHHIYLFEYDCNCTGCGYMDSVTTYQDYCIQDNFP